MRRGRRWSLALGSLLLGLLVGEAALRFLLFSAAADGWGPARAPRRAALYAPSAGRDHWKLDVLFGPPKARRAAPGFDPRFGWLAAEIDPQSLQHADEGSLAGRRPVLLFGDSYAQCVQRAGDCWPSLLERSPLADRLRLLNYGVGGYGMDQAFLLMEAVLPRFSGREPVVVFAVLVDDDLDRCWLPLRHFPKPWFELVEGQLARHAPESSSPEAFVRSHPPAITSYLARWVLFGSRLVGPGTATRWTEGRDLVDRKMALNARLIDEVQALWERSGVRGFFVLFHGRKSLEAALGGRSSAWQDDFLRRQLTQRQLPYVASDRALLAALESRGLGLDQLYYPDSPGRNHYTTLANEIVFEVLLAGLAAAAR